MGGISMATISSHRPTRSLKISLSWAAALLALLLLAPTLNGEEEAPTPTPRAWPEQFHSLMVMNNTGSGKLQIIDLWYDWPGGRNLNLIHNQLGKVLHDVEWNNGTSFFYTLEEGNGRSSGDVECRSMHFEVGILRPNWLDGATYVGQRQVDGFLCNVWEKVDFITYYEDVVTNRPVHWVFYTGMEAHVMTFEVGVVLEDSGWQAPSYCFEGHNSLNDVHGGSSINTLPLPASFSSSSSSINRVLQGRETSG